MNNEELDKQVEQGNKRMAIVSVVWSTFFSPILFISCFHPMNVIIWLIIVIIGVSLSPKIVNKIWK